MPLVAQQQPVSADKIYVTHPDAKIDREALKERLARLAQKGGITERDERLLEYLRELNVLSLNQVHRLMFPEAKERTAYQRMS